MADMPRYLALPFPNSPVIQDGQHVGFTVGITLAHEGQTLTEQVDAVCGPDQAAALLAGPVEAYTAWSRQIIEDQDLVTRANAAMAARLASMTAD
jgi:hypothetical protein